jgi:hypothetical protein
MSRIVIVILVHNCHKPIDSIKLFVSLRRRNMFSVRYGQTFRVEFLVNDRTMDNVQNCDCYSNYASLYTTFRRHTSGLID